MLWFLVCDDGGEGQIITSGLTPQDAYDNFMDIYGGYHYCNPEYYKAEYSPVKVQVVEE